jgi:signal transduction histidine kinase
VRRVVDRRGGSVEVGAGEDGRGTVFTVRLPVGPRSAQSPVDSPAASR